MIHRRSIVWCRRIILLILVSAGILRGNLLLAGEKVIVVGFDGVDAANTQKWMDEGKLPNLAALRESGTFRPLQPTLPAQTPVSWSTFSTGVTCAAWIPSPRN